MIATSALSGCGSGGDKPAAAATAGATASTSADLEAAFIADAEKTVPTYVVEPKRDHFIEVGYDVCQTVDRGNLDDSKIITTIASTEGLEVAYAEAIFWAARDNLCPDL